MMTTGLRYLWFFSFLIPMLAGGVAVFNFFQEFRTESLIGKIPPNIDLPVLEGEHKDNQIARLVGKPWLLNVWASWCRSCLIEHPLLLRLAAEGVLLIGVNYKDTDEKAKQWLQHRGNPYQFSFVDKKGLMEEHWGVQGVPETFVIDAKGVLRYKISGVFTQMDWDETISPLLLKLNTEANH